MDPLLPSPFVACHSESCPNPICESINSIPLYIIVTRRSCHGHDICAHTHRVHASSGSDIISAKCFGSHFYRIALQGVSAGLGPGLG